MKQEDLVFNIIQLFEEVLEEKGMSLPDEHREGEPDEANIFGSTYYTLEEDIKALLEVEE